MKHKDLLLPYSCQKAGWIIAIAIPVLFLVYLLVCGRNRGLLSEQNLQYVVGILAMLFFVAVFLICASREKDEDEIIRITLFAIIYELVFKIRLWLNRRESK